MSEQNPEQTPTFDEVQDDQTHQDPAEPKQVDTEVQTDDQPAEPTSVTVAPEEAADVKTDTIHGKEYEVTADRGYRAR